MKKLIILCLISISAFANPNGEHNTNEEWKKKYFKMFPEADTNKDGELTWKEYRTHKDAQKPKKELTEQEKQKANQYRKNYLAKHPEADTNKDGDLTWTEIRLHKNTSKKDI